MFDTHHHRTDPQHVTVHSKTTEHRAPTDESVRLLKEMEDAAREKLISITRIEGNTLNATWHLFEDYQNFRMMAVCRFDLNGKEHRLEVEIKRELRYKPDEIAANIYKAIAEELAKVLTLALFNSQSREITASLRL